MSHKQTALDALTTLRAELDGLVVEVTTSYAILTLARSQAMVRCAFQEVEQIQELKRQHRIVPANVARGVVPGVPVPPGYPLTLPSPIALAHDEGGEA